ncbi:MAG: outer membrane protein assembly factor BamA [bacterium]
MRQILYHIQFMMLLLTFSSLATVLNTAPLLAQDKARSYIIAGVSVEGNTYADAQTIITISGLKVGEEIKIPGPKQQEAIKNLWLRNQFESIDIIIDKITASGIFLTIKVKEFQRFSWLDVKGADKVSVKDIEKAVGKIKGDILSAYEEDLARDAVRDLYEKEGLMYAKITTTSIPTDTGLYARLEMNIEEGADFYVDSILFTGNEKLSASDLAGAMEDTKTKTWWKFWSSSKFDKLKYEEDKKKLSQFFRSKGFIDAEIVKDTVIYRPDVQKVCIHLDIVEGPQYKLRSVTFEGNTVYPQELLFRRLNIPLGEPYDAERFDKNLSGNEDQSDVASMYLDNGYLGANLVKEERKSSGDSLDVIVKVFERDRYIIRKVEIVGNSKTKDKVIRRELFTRPGEYFNRSAIIRSVRGLGVLNYFNPEALKPDIKPVDNTRVDVLYRVEERSTDTFNASMGYAGTFGLTGSIGITLNNFSFSEPLRGGGGQILNINAEFGQQSRYQTVQLGFTEPWLNNTPTTLGVNLYSIRQNFVFELMRYGASVNIGRRLRWPDDYFRVDGVVRAQYNQQNASQGVFRAFNGGELSLTGSISRISLDNAIFPTSGSRFTYSSTFAAGGIGIGKVDYLKNTFNLEMFHPLASVDGNPRLVLYMSTDMGYVAGIKSDTNILGNELFFMGGNGLGGFAITPLRGYLDRSIGPSGGGRVMTRHVVETRFALSLNPMPIYLLAFAEAGNVWENLRSADPFNLKRSAGLGVRVLLNPIGLLGFDYGYGFDPQSATGPRSGWQFHFQFGR